MGPVAGPVTAALRRCQAYALRHLAPGDPARVGPYVLVLSPDLRVVARDGVSRQWPMRGWGVGRLAELGLAALRGPSVSV
jgi:hypothetical protein